MEPEKLSVHYIVNSKKFELILTFNKIGAHECIGNKPLIHSYTIIS